MKNNHLTLIARLALCLGAVPAAFAQGSSFNYQGRLSDGGQPANGSYDFRFAIYDALASGNGVSGVLTNASTSVSNGVFSVSLDFGSAPFDGSARWLEIAVRTNGSTNLHVLLAPRQALAPVPYAITSGKVTGSVAAGQLTGSIPPANIGLGTITSTMLATGSVTSNQLAAGSVTTASLANGAVGSAQIADGAVTTADLDSSIGLWSKAGASIYYNAGKVGVGTSTPQMTLDVNGNVKAAAFTGSGAGLTDLNPAYLAPGTAVINISGNATNITGRLADAQLSTNVALLNTNQTFTGSNTYAGVLIATNVNNLWKGTLTGNVIGNVTGNTTAATNFIGSLAGDVTGTQGATVVANVGGQTAANVASGASAANIATSGNTASTIVKRDASGNFSAGAITAASVSGDGAGLLNLNAARLASGTVSDARLSSNIALRNGGNTNSGNQIVLGNVGIGTTTPQAQLDVAGDISVHGNLKLASGVGSSGAGRLQAISSADLFGLTLNSTTRIWDLVSITSDSPNYFGIIDKTAGFMRFKIDQNGYVGIDTATPQAKLDVNGTLNASGVATVNAAGSYTASGLKVIGALETMRTTPGAVGDWVFGNGGALGLNNDYVFYDGVGGGAGVAMVIKQGTGNVGIGTLSPNLGAYSAPSLTVLGTASYMSAIEVGAQIPDADSQAYGDFAIVHGNTTSTVKRLALIRGATDGPTPNNRGGKLSLDVKNDGRSDFTEAMTIRSGGNVGIGTTTPQEKLHVIGNAIVTGTNTVKVLSITGGADVAEPFAMSGGETPKGAVVVIDDQHPGQLKLSERAYDKRVAGIVSGAGGVNPGLTLSQHELVEGGQNVALTGRVYALADATTGPIEPGDLLTTSSVPGHAMKVNDSAQAQGAILGKAMSRLESGRGLVLVLVTLQ